MKPKEPATVFEWCCSKCPSSVWAHSDDIKKLAALASFHYNKGHELKSMKKEDVMNEIFRLVPVVNPAKP